MNAQSYSMRDLLRSLSGPIVWALHFFAVYLTEAMLYSSAGSASSATVRLLGAALTATALIALLLMRSSTLKLAGKAGHASSPLSFARPLVDISIVAVLLTSIPLFLLEACSPS